MNRKDYISYVTKWVDKDGHVHITVARYFPIRRSSEFIKDHVDFSK